MREEFDILEIMNVFQWSRSPVTNRQRNDIGVYKIVELPWKYVDKHGIIIVRRINSLVSYIVRMSNKKSIV